MDVNTPLRISFIGYMNMPLFLHCDIWIMGALDSCFEQTTECKYRDEF